MSPQFINALELLMIMLYVVSRIIGTVAIIYLLIQSRISIGWQTFLILTTIVIGLGFNVHYENPNSKHHNTQIEEVK